MAGSQRTHLAVIESPLFFQIIEMRLKMDINVITQIVTTVGFPIVAAGALFWYVNKLTETHKQETEALRKTLESNTNILIELKELIRNLVINHDK